MNLIKISISTGIIYLFLSCSYKRSEEKDKIPNVEKIVVVDTVIKIVEKPIVMTKEEMINSIKSEEQKAPLNYLSVTDWNYELKYKKV